jgi:hypothetical protein
MAPSNLSRDLVGFLNILLLFFKQAVGTDAGGVVEAGGMGGMGNGSIGGAGGGSGGTSGLRLDRLRRLQPFAYAPFTRKLNWKKIRNMNLDKMASWKKLRNMNLDKMSSWKRLATESDLEVQLNPP